ncbi:hypothetical protein [Microcystis sp.]|uniref:hypothetical protein n=1 Tax=Microcystis sp. TaxID=1127 RepID=UPI00391F55C9
MLAELAAAEIAKIAFEAVIGKLTEGAMDKGVELWQKIKQKLQKEPAAAKVLAAAEQTKSEAMIEQQVVPFLQVEMLKDTNFAQEIQTLAQQIKSACFWEKAIHTQAKWDKDKQLLVAEDWKANQREIEKLKRDKNSDPPNPIDCNTK